MGQKITTALPQVIRSHNNNHDNELDQDAEADHFLVTPQKHIHQHHSFPAHSSNASSPSKINDTCESIVHSHLNPLYDLVGVCNHHGSLNGGHYIAHVDTNYGRSKEKAPRWTCFNDERVSKANSSSIAGPTAYVLFYQLREDGNIGTYYASQNQEENLQHQSRGQARGHEGTEVDQEGSEHSR